MNSYAKLTVQYEMLFSNNLSLNSCLHIIYLNNLNLNDSGE